MVDTNKLKALMLENNVTQKELADELEIAYRTFNHKLNNNLIFTVKEIMYLVKRFKIKQSDIGKIFFREEN